MDKKKAGKIKMNIKVVTCERCGSQVWCPNFTNECQCGTLYNSFGQMLAPYEDWTDEWLDALDDFVEEEWL